MLIKKEIFEISLPVIENYNKMYCLCLQRIGNEAHDIASELEKREVPTRRKAVNEMDISKAHGLCHLGEKLRHVTFKALGVKLTSILKPCAGCCRANAKAKGVHKSTKTVVSETGERLLIDTSGPYPESVEGNRYWICMVDDMTRKSWSKFRKLKSEMPKIVEEKIEHLKGQGHTVKYIHCDNIGEHQEKLQKVYVSIKERFHQVIFFLTFSSAFFIPIGLPFSFVSLSSSSMFAEQLEKVV